VHVYFFSLCYAMLHFFSFSVQPLYIYMSCTSDLLFLTNVGSEKEGHCLNSSYYSFSKQTKKKTLLFPSSPIYLSPIYNFCFSNKRNQIFIKKSHHVMILLCNGKLN
jgi:hypothetical protein